LYNDFNIIPTLRQTKPRERPEAAICVRKSSARRVLHFTPLNAASCVLHRPANRVIHRLQLYLYFIQFVIEKYFQSTELLKLMGTVTSYAGITPLRIIKSSGTFTCVTPLPDSDKRVLVDVVDQTPDNSWLEQQTPEQSRMCDRSLTRTHNRPVID
jgi:hypothetical protein